MNWLSKFQRILGRFWSVVFSEQNFTLGVRNLHSLFSTRMQGRYDAWAAGQVVADRGRYEDRMPFAIFLLKARVSRTGSGETRMESVVVHPASSLDDILEGTASLDDREEHGGYVVQSRFGVPVPHHMTDHVIDYKRTLFNGVDYEWKDGAFLFHFDPAMLHLPEICVTDAEGVLNVYWKIFGWCSPEEALKDAVAAFDSEELNPYADTVWDIHQHGANYLNARKLLGEVTGSVVCEKDGAVDALWQEQEEQCMLVGDKVYHAPQGTACNYAHGDTVKVGDVLFGTMKMVSSEDMPDNVDPADIPGVRVMTDVGELIAENADTEAVVTDVGYVLPLKASYSAGVSQAYVDLCAANLADTSCLRADVPSIVNPFIFVMKTLRRGSGILASLTVDTSMAIIPALECIRKSINASGMMTVYLQAEGDTVGSVESSFTADAGNAAVAVDATITVQDMFAEAEIAL